MNLLLHCMCNPLMPHPAVLCQLPRGQHSTAGHANNLRTKHPAPTMNALEQNSTPRDMTALQECMHRHIRL